MGSMPIRFWHERARAKNYQEGITDFANAHAATVEMVTGLQQQKATLQELLPAMQQQINVMCLQMANMHMSNATNT
ncbi:MAG: hypothetical protein GY874_18725, partial [Desulfobacteraceae bacterium]|nr:hypothetical protein [Desulfobacteraceae bacterium]